MEIKRSSYQGVFNIIRFNWHFYLLAILFIALLFTGFLFFSFPWNKICITLSVILFITSLISLLVSFYVYDRSDLYLLKWLENLNDKKVLIVNAGFDEITDIVKSKFPEADIVTCDFYNPVKHTEVSIKRARIAYPPTPDTVKVETKNLPFENKEFDFIIAMLSLHEIRNSEERLIFFNELNRILKSSGHVFVTEHLRDINNFMAYTLGFFHFHSKAVWKKTFRESGFTLIEEIKTTPFITTFNITNNGSSN